MTLPLFLAVLLVGASVTLCRMAAARDRWTR